MNVLPPSKRAVLRLTITAVWAHDREETPDIPEHVGDSPVGLREQDGGVGLTDEVLIRLADGEHLFLSTGHELQGQGSLNFWPQHVQVRRQQVDEDLGERASSKTHNLIISLQCFHFRSHVKHYLPVLLTFRDLFGFLFFDLLDSWNVLALYLPIKSEEWVKMLNSCAITFKSSCCWIMGKPSR